MISCPSLVLVALVEDGVAIRIRCRDDLEVDGAARQEGGGEIAHIIRQGIAHTLMDWVRDTVRNEDEMLLRGNSAGSSSRLSYRYWWSLQI
eukprot:CAMPEP_0175002042 /NCGR_PEP_ID=MMETSP0005-20121125/3467_1 /TAXON_ID=420556 /ORGANISM="Ochromonas sp., Strain CCMP1393" /LENGTH=90 /DNA_ID=CAMNT_0016256991 /DNA_START=530 /DNA_END=802 /DNA_ORIENTATION=-